MLTVLSLLAQAEIFVTAEYIYNDYIKLLNDGRAYVNGKFLTMLNDRDYALVMRNVIKDNVKCRQKIICMVYTKRVGYMTYP